MNTPDEYCPFCDARVIMRERRPDGNAKCAWGHTFRLTQTRERIDPIPPVKTPEELNADFRRVLSDLAEGISETLEQSAEKERAAIVAFLRRAAPNAPTRRGADELAWCADAVERGDHWKEESP